jgi:predicted benzoate:H+ symporter BenE
MFDHEFKDELKEPRARTSVVVGAIAMVALIFAYLGVYAASSSLVSAGLLQGWDGKMDPRPRWLAMAWAGQMGTFLVIAWSLRLLSGRQLRQIEQMEDELS